MVPWLDGARQGLILLVGALALARCWGAASRQTPLSALLVGLIGSGGYAVAVWGALMLVSPDRRLGFCQRVGQLEPGGEAARFSVTCPDGREEVYRRAVRGGVFLGPKIDVGGR